MRSRRLAPMLLVVAVLGSGSGATLGLPESDVRALQQRVYREAPALMAKFRRAAIEGDKSLIPEMLRVAVTPGLMEAYGSPIDAARYQAMISIGRLVEGRPPKELLKFASTASSDHPADLGARIALARIIAENTRLPRMSPERNLRRRIEIFLDALPLSTEKMVTKARDYNEAIRLRHSRFAHWPIEALALRETADMVAVAASAGVGTSEVERWIDFSVDPDPSYKIRLAHMKKAERISWLIAGLQRTIAWTDETDRQMQALADEGKPAARAVEAKLRYVAAHRKDFRERPNDIPPDVRSSTPNLQIGVGIGALLNVLRAIGDPGSKDVVAQFLNDPGVEARDQARGAVESLKHGEPKVIASMY